MRPYLDRTCDTDGAHGRRLHRRRVRGADDQVLMATPDGHSDEGEADRIVVRTAEAILADDALADQLEDAVIRYIVRRWPDRPIGPTSDRTTPRNVREAVTFLGMGRPSPGASPPV